MKKALLTILLIILVTSCFAAVSQKIHPVDSPLYKAISDIYLMTGHAMPSSSGPWSSAELLSMLGEVDRLEVPDVLKDSYDHVLSELGKDLTIDAKPITLQFTPSSAVELYLHTNTDGQTRPDTNRVTERTFTGRESWSYDLVHSNPLLELDLEIDVADSIYLFLGATLKNGFHFGVGYENEHGASVLGSNIIGLQDFSGNSAVSIDPNMPYRAFGSFGGKNWMFQIGRDRLSWGLGRTGNLGISDNLPYHDMLRFTAFSTKVKYTFLISSFPHEENFYDPYVGSDTQEKEPVQGIKLYLAHRIEGRVFSDRLSFAVTEAIMYSSANGTIDPKIFNPAIIFHNFYDPSNANSTLVAEVDFTPIKGLNVYGQLILDDLAISGEDAGSPDNKGYPNAMGYLAGVTYAMPLLDGLLSVNLEGAIIDPYTYLRYNQSPYDDSEGYGLNYVVSTRTYVIGKPDALVYDEYFLGYRYGSDSAVANLNATWRKPGFLTLSANLFFMAHGTHDKWTKWNLVGGNGDQWKNTSVTPTSSHETGNYRYDTSDRNAVCYTFDAGLYGSVNLNSRLNVYAQADFIAVRNIMNRSGVNENDFQFAVGAKYSL